MLSKFAGSPIVLGPSPYRPTALSAGGINAQKPGDINAFQPNVGQKPLAA